MKSLLKLAFLTGLLLTGPLSVAVRAVAVSSAGRQDDKVQEEKDKRLLDAARGGNYTEAKAALETRKRSSGSCSPPAHRSTSRTATGAAF
jgi:hypothetical protein